MGAFYGDELIGTFGIQKRTLNNGLVCGQAHWPAIAPEWQGKSIFSELTKIVLARYNDLDVLFNFFPDRAKKAVEKSLDMKMLDTPEMILNSPESFENPGVIVSTAAAKTTFKKHEAEKLDIYAFDNTPVYRLWRYAQHPFYAYDVVSLDSGEYAVVKNFTDPVTRDTYGDIVDIECDHGDRRTMKKLIIGACWHLRAQGMDDITTWAMPDTELREVVEEIGFKKGKQKQYYFGLKVIDSHHDYLYDFSRWRLQQCDSQKY